jgi:hypothetical protein
MDAALWAAFSVVARERLKIRQGRVRLSMRNVDAA